MENNTMYDEIDEVKFEKSKAYVREHYDQIEIEDAGGVIVIGTEPKAIIHNNVANMTAIYPYELRYAFHIEATLAEAEACGCGCGCGSCGGECDHEESGEPEDEELARIRREKLAKLMGHD
jgi:hypothetical protein